MTEKSNGKYIDTISVMNDSWKIMLKGFYHGDYRVTYLRSFEFALNANMRHTTLWKNRRYIRITRLYRLPADAKYVKQDKYRAYIWLYTEIMRDEGLLTKSKEEEVEGELDDGIFGGLKG